MFLEGENSANIYSGLVNVYRKATLDISTIGHWSIELIVILARKERLNLVRG